MKPALILITLLLAACSQKSANPTVRIATAGAGLQTFSLPITFAEALGYYKEEGVDVSIDTLPSMGKTMQALVGGSVDVAGMSYAQTLQVAAEGQLLRFFFTMTKLGSLGLVVAPSANGRIRRAEDLKGALIGVASPGSTSHLFLNFYMAAHGLQPTDFRTVSIGLGASAIAAVENGRVDAVTFSGGDHLRLLRRHPGLRILVDTSTPEGMQEIYGTPAISVTGVIARQNWLDKNPETARRLSRALLRAQQWLNTHSAEEIRERLPSSFRSEDIAMDLEIIKVGVASYTADGKMLDGSAEVMKRYLDATVENVRNAKIDLALTWTNEFLPGAK